MSETATGPPEAAAEPPAAAEEAGAAAEEAGAAAEEATAAADEATAAADDVAVDEVLELHAAKVTDKAPMAATAANAFPRVKRLVMWCPFEGWVIETRRPSDMSIAPPRCWRDKP